MFSNRSVTQLGRSHMLPCNIMGEDPLMQWVGAVYVVTEQLPP